MRGWFDPETVWLAEPSGKRGRPATFSDAARSVPPLVVCRQTVAGQRTARLTRGAATPPSTARQCMVACARGAARTACAVIPARKNARPGLEATPGAQARNEILRATRRLGRTIWRRWSGYHRRSLVEI